MLKSERVVTITDKAAQKVKEFIEKEGRQGAGLRVYVAGGGCSGLTYGLALEDQPASDDNVFEEKGIRIIIDPFSLRYLKGSQIDYVESLMGAGFKIDNPNVRSTCACGQSFSA